MENLAQNKALHHLNTGEKLLQDGDIDRAIQKFQEALHLDPHLVDAFYLRGEAFLKKDCFDPAIWHFQRVLSLDPENINAKNQLKKVNLLRKERNEKLTKKREVFGYSVLKCLGFGWEGTVYLVKNAKGKKYIVKLFYPYRVDQINQNDLIYNYRKPVKSARSDLLNLSRCLKRKNIDTLYPIDIMEKNGRIEGIRYNYEKLMKIQDRHLRHSDFIMGVLGAFFRTQSYLIRNLRLTLSDANSNQFMITRSGHFRYTDYGISIIPIDDFRCREDHLETYVFIRLLYNLFNPEKIHYFDPANYDVIFDKSNGLLSALGKYDFLQQCFEYIKNRDFKYFLDYSLYEEMANRFPKQLSLTCRYKVITAEYGSLIKRNMLNLLRSHSNIK